MALVFVSEIDECIADGPGRAACDPGKCKNTAGSYECSCTTAGYEIKEDGVTCGDENECSRDVDPCPEHSNCGKTNNDGNQVVVM